MASPAGPHLTPNQWKIVGELCRLNPNADTGPIRREIQAYFAARTLAATYDPVVKENQ